MKRMLLPLVMLLVALSAACGDDKGNKPIDAGIDAPVDAPPTRLTGCLDQPGTIPAAPSGALPCDLVPPGLQL